MVEWLIQRFEIQHFEPDSLMYYFLPYFDQSVIFNKLCRLFDEIPDNWYWILNSYRNMENSTSFALGSVIKFCHRDENFLFNLGQKAKNSPDSPLAVLFLKLATRSVVTCDHNEKNHEKLLAKLFPFVEEGFSKENDSYEWWKTCLMIASTIFARFSIDTEIGEDVIGKAMKSARKFESLGCNSIADSFLLFEVFIVNQEHDLSKVVSPTIKKRILKTDNWFEIILNHHMNLLKAKNKRLDDVFNYLSLDKELLDEIFPKLAEHNQLTDFIKDQRIKSVSEQDNTTKFISLLSGNYHDRREALETGNFTKAELNSYLLSEEDEKCITLALTVADDIEELEKTMTYHYPKLISKKFAQRLVELNSKMEFYYSLFEKTVNGMNGRKFLPKVGDADLAKLMTEKVVLLCESDKDEMTDDDNKYSRLISLFLRCIKDDSSFNTDQNQISIIKIFESIPATPEASKYWIENCPKLQDSDDHELTISCVDRCIQARVCKFLMEGDHDMNGFWDLVLPKDKFIFSMMVYNLEKKERDLALSQFRLLDTDSSFFDLALKTISGKGVLGKKKAYKSQLIDILREKGDVMKEHWLEIEANAYQSFIDDEKDMVKLLSSDFELLRNLSLRSFDKSDKTFETLGASIDELLDTVDFDSEEFAKKSILFEYADLSKNIPVLFKVLEKSHLMPVEISDKFISLDFKLEDDKVDELLDTILSQSNPGHGLLKNLSKILNNHKVGGDRVYKKIYSTKLVDGAGIPDNIRNFFDIIRSLKIKNFSEVIFRFVMHVFEKITLNQDMLLVLQCLEDIFDDDQVISKISDDILRIDLFMKHLQNNKLAVNIHTNILKVLGTVADKRPNSVLDHVITVLTSLTNIRVNDIYSAQVCGDTLEAIIPPLFSAVDSIIITGDGQIMSVTDVKDRRKLIANEGGRKATKFDIAMKISKVIAQTCKTMQKARHRKLQVLNSMNKSLGVEFGYVLIAQLVLNNNIHDATQEFMGIMNSESIVNCVKMLISCLKEEVFSKSCGEFMNYSQFSRTIMNIVNSCLNQPEVIEKMRLMEDSGKFLSDVLDYLYSIRRMKSVDTKLEKLVLRSLQLMIILLPVNVLCNSLETISNISSVRTTLEKLAERLELVAEKRHGAESANSVEVEQLIETFPQCVSVLVKSVEKQLENIGNESVQGQKRKTGSDQSPKPLKNQGNRNKVAQLGILAIKSLVSIVCTNPDSNHDNILINPLLPCLMSIVTNKNVDRHVRASSMLCIAEMSQFLDSAFLPFLNKFVAVIQTFLVDFDQNQNKLTHTNEDIICYSLKSLQHLVANIGQFLSPHVSGIMLTLGNLRSRSVLIEKRLRGLENLISLNIPMRIFFPNMTNIIGRIENHSSLVPLLDLTKNYIEKQPPVSVKAHLDSIRTWTETVLGVRQKCIDSKSGKESFEMNEQIEEKFGLAFTEFVKKLEESVFPKTFYKLFIWATDDFKSKPGLAYSFYHLCTILADKLKSTFVITVAAQMIGNIKEVLSYYSEYRVLNKKKNSLEMLAKVLKLINTISIYDRREFVKTHLFDSCGEILIELIGKVTDIAGEDFVKNDLSPSISSMCLALSVSSGNAAVLENTPMVGGKVNESGDDVLSWKNVHYKILQKTRDTRASVRKASVQIIHDIAIKIGGDYTLLMPEAVPFFAELLEDDSEEVEEFTKKCLQGMESAIGENIQQYF